MIKYEPQGRDARTKDWGVTVFYIYRPAIHMAGPQELGGLPAASCTELGCAQKLICLGNSPAARLCN